MQNDKGDYVDLYIPRRCNETNRILDAKDSASIQLNILADGVNVKHKKGGDNNQLTLVLSGFVRNKGLSDAALNKFLHKHGIINFE